MKIYDEIFMYVMYLYENIHNNDDCPVELPLNASYRELVLTARQACTDRELQGLFVVRQ